MVTDRGLVLTTLAAQPEMQIAAMTAKSLPMRSPRSGFECCDHLTTFDEERTAVMRELNESAREIDAPRRDATLGARLRKSLAAAT